MEAPGAALRPPPSSSGLQQEYRTCAKVRYCFTCEAAFCLDCCPGHSALHHPGHPGGCRIAQVKLVRDVVCVREEDVAGIGYDWRSIQKFKDVASGSRFVPLRRNILQGRLGIYCENCNDRMYLRSRHCCTACRIQKVVTGGGRGRSKVTALVQTQFSQKAVMDCFCTVCSRLFASSCCSDHLAGHHPGENGAVVRLVRHMGSIFAPVDDLVGFAPPILAGIQTFMVNGMVMVPLVRSEGHPEPEGELGNSCGKCFKAISRDSSYCCLQCRVYGT